MVRADTLVNVVGNRHLEVLTDEIQRMSITGVADASEYVKQMKVSWEAHAALLQRSGVSGGIQAIKRKNLETAHGWLS